MKAIIIDNNTKHILALKSATELAGYKSIVNSWSAFNYHEAIMAEMVILSGGKNMAVPSHIDDLANELRLVRGRVKPILGICLGAEVIAMSFSAELKYRPEREMGVASIKVVEQDPVFGGLHEFHAYEAHKFYMDMLPTTLKVLAESLSGIEVFKHKELPIYGMQFHPEVDNKLSAYQLLVNFMQLAKTA